MWTGQLTPLDPGASAPPSSKPRRPWPLPISRPAASRSPWWRWAWAGGSTAPTSSPRWSAPSPRSPLDHMKYLGDTLEPNRQGEGGHRQTRRPLRHRGAGSRAGRGAPAGGAPECARGAAGGPTFGCCRPSTSGPGRLDSRGRTSAATQAWRTAFSWRFPSAGDPDPRPCARGLPRRGYRVASTGGAGGCSTWPTIRTGWRRSCPRCAPTPHRARCTHWSAFWATRNGRPCWSGWTRWSTADSSPWRPRRRSGGGISIGSGHGWPAPTALRRTPNGRSSRTFPHALREVQRGAGTVLVTGSFHTVGDVMEALGLGE